MNGISPLPDHSALLRDLVGVIPDGRLITDPLRRLAYGTDASFYRLVPQVVAEVADEDEVRGVLAACRRHGAPVTFRAAGTSLSGQAVGDSVLMILGNGWTRAIVENNGEAIRLQPGVIGADANRRLAAFARKIGPDPASIDSCKIGGIAANNASGMCCGTSDNSYQTVMSMRLMLADGTLVDTGDAGSVAAFSASHADLLDRLGAMGARVRADEALSRRIRRKFAIKNTTGYSLNALVDFTDPLDILTHLMIGSEGTLGFIAEITYRTVPDHADKASALLLFPDIAEACRAVTLLKSAPVSAVELMDRAALRSVEDKPGMPAQIRGLAEGVTALLVETRAESPAMLSANIAAIGTVLDGVATLFPPDFTDDPDEYGTLWKIRKGLFPAVGAVRPVGTTVIIEDVAFPIESLAAATVDLEHLCARHGYHEAIIFGHALDGNLHFVFTQDFGVAAEVERYSRFMDDVCELVVKKYDGSLKAEHGTGRNMAPFVEMEWGAEATALMWEIKRTLDPLGLLNPGVLLNANPKAHLENLKPLPAADALVDTCIECGFCERMCPSHGLTLSPRQRITSWREISRLAALGDGAAELRRLYDYQGIDTCAACGLCATACPVEIETGKLTKRLRGQRLGGTARSAGDWAARHYGAAMTATRIGLGAAGLVSAVAGPKAMAALAGAARRLSGDRVPKVGGHLPTAARHDLSAGDLAGETVVYFPTCAARIMGPAAGDPERDSLPTVMTRVLGRAGYHVVIPDGLDGLCCGQAFESKGLQATADRKAAELEAALARASDNGRFPIVMDASTCTLRMKTFLDGRLRVLDSVEFLHDAALPRLNVRKQAEPVLVHVNCGARKMGLDGKMIGLARACADTAVVPEGVGCCGFAGDKGFTTPELNDFALRHLAAQVPRGCEAGYSSNRTCEIGLADHADLPYRSIVTLLDRVTR
ncbi:FAD-binding and (Fe-S)-binding domain-containing protein [Magnetospirillum sp. SS-4]|uniref:FAD-binding and (Fe-S)-binding domain-containing protein n=1 Tax=Magnetospirillum sp. SS-4 TaxID=2681465 RepID=UPI00137C8751|nr:FAD-binding and (Fe-S)-binding domain-containing protein [Magnetospirillum sp. SS-4]CAA7621410.1 FAD/FMN-containing dehydrogenase [Magnetospirillum sp. SS-4]